MRLLFLLFVVTPVVAAQTIYKTVENGVTTFSDAPTADGNAEVITVDVPPPAQDGLLEERLEAMRDTTDRMAADRREREKQRAALRALQAPSPAPTTVLVEQPVPLWVGGYWPSHGRPIYPRPPFRPGPPARPQPLPQPVAPPGWSVMKPGNAQLMRPIVSSRQP